MNRCLIFCILILTQNGFSQKNYFGIGVNLGYRSSYNEGGVYLASRLINFIDVNVGMSKGINKGYGATSELKVHLIKYKFQPFVGFAFIKTFGSHFDVTEANNPTYYKVNPNEFFVPQIGITKRINIPEDSEKPNLRMIFLVSLNLSYSYATKESKLIYESGYYPNSQEQRINNSMKNGLGASISLNFLFSKIKS